MNYHLCVGLRWEWGENPPGCCGASSCLSSADSAASDVAALRSPAAAVGRRRTQSSSRWPAPQSQRHRHPLPQSSSTLERGQVTRSPAARSLAWETRDALMLLDTMLTTSHSANTRAQTHTQQFKRMQLLRNDFNMISIWENTILENYYQFCSFFFFFVN